MGVGRKCETIAPPRSEQCGSDSGEGRTACLGLVLRSSNYLWAPPGSRAPSEGRYLKCNHFWHSSKPQPNSLAVAFNCSRRRVEEEGTTAQRTNRPPPPPQPSYSQQARWPDNKDDQTTTSTRTTTRRADDPWTKRKRLEAESSIAFVAFVAAVELAIKMFTWTASIINANGWKWSEPSTQSGLLAKGT